GQIYAVAANASGEFAFALTVSGGRVRLSGDLRTLANETLALAGRETVRVTVFVDYGPGGGFTYRFDLPVDVSGAGVRALSPRVERCRNARACGGAATHVSAPDGVSVNTTLAGEPNA
ncbi:MAG: hypothetical protein ABEH77_04885, partial [Halobacteriaceae archaeon]